MILRLFKFKILCKLDSFKEIINFCNFKKFSNIFFCCRMMAGIDTRVRRTAVTGA